MAKAKHTIDLRYNAGLVLANINFMRPSADGSAYRLVAHRQNYCCATKTTHTAFGQKTLIGWLKKNKKH